MLVEVLAARVPHSRRAAPLAVLAPLSLAQSCSGGQLDRLLPHAADRVRALGHRLRVSPAGSSTARKRTRSAPSSIRAPRPCAGPAPRAAQAGVGRNPTVTTSSSPCRARSMSDLSAKGSAMRRHRPGRGSRHGHRAPRDGGASGSSSAVAAAAKSASASTADRLRGRGTTTARSAAHEGLLDLVEDRGLRRHPLLAPRVGTLRRGTPGWRPRRRPGSRTATAWSATAAPRRPRRSRREHETDAGVGPVRISCTSSRSRCSRSTASKTVSWGMGTRGLGQHRAERLDDAPLGREDPVHVPAQRLGQGEQPERLRSGRAVDDHHVPAAGEHLGAQLQQREDLLGPGITVSSSAVIGSTPAASSTQSR